MTDSVDTLQKPVLDWLQAPGTHGLSENILRIDTHGAFIFLAGNDAYKIKRSVKFPFMDFSTLEKRREACKREISVNKDNAPDIYLGLLPITRRGHSFSFGGAGEVVEWAVHMRRFNENATLDKMVEKRLLGKAMIDELGRIIHYAHKRAPVKDGLAATIDLEHRIDDILTGLRKQEAIFPSKEVIEYSEIVRSEFQTIRLLLLTRGRLGYVRRCHGDLHLGNVVVENQHPILFDAIEFDESIATCDIFYDLAFMLMDLWKHGECEFSNRLLNRYLEKSGHRHQQLHDLKSLPLFMSLRASVRAQVTAVQSHFNASNAYALSQKAKAYFDLAQDFLKPRPPILIAIGGFSGSGKSTLAASIAPSIGRRPGCIHLRSDVERKLLFGVDEIARLPASAYSTDVSAALYSRMHELAVSALAGGSSVILDATHQRQEDRSAACRLAAQLNIPFAGIWLEAPRDVLVQRVTERRNDASDATAEVVSGQVERGAGDITWMRLSASQSKEALQSQALALIRE